MNITLTIEIDGTVIHDLTWDKLIALRDKLNEMTGYTEVLTKPSPVKEHMTPNPLTTPCPTPSWKPWCDIIQDSIMPRQLTNSIIVKP